MNLLKLILIGLRSRNSTLVEKNNKIYLMIIVFSQLHPILNCMKPEMEKIIKEPTFMFKGVFFLTSHGPWQGWWTSTIPGFYCVIIRINSSGSQCFVLNVLVTILICKVLKIWTIKKKRTNNQTTGDFQIKQYYKINKY